MRFPIDNWEESLCQVILALSAISAVRRLIGISHTFFDALAMTRWSVQGSNSMPVQEIDELIALMEY